MKQAGTTTYAVNGLGQRVKKNNGTDTFFAYDEAGHLIGEYDATGAPIEETVWLGDLPVAVLKPNATSFDVFYVWTDNLGTPRLITDAANQSRWEWPNADPFGNNLPNEDPAGLGAFSYNLRFPGQYYDVEKGSNYNYFRDYDPAIGRYVESDPIGLKGGPNTYAYVLGDPLGDSDSTGQCPWCVGAAIGFGTEFITQMAENDWRIECVDWVDVAISTGVGALGPGLFATGKTAFKSSKALRTLRTQLGRARTVNRRGKIQGRINEHRTQISDAITTQLGFQGAKRFGKAVNDRNKPNSCTKDCP
jgi:RHS repeat-associated protein